MDNFLFVSAFLDLASKGSFFRKVISTVLRVCAILLVIGGIVAVVEVLRFVMQLPTSGVLGGIIFEALLVVAVYVVAHISWIRAGDISRLPDSKFNIIPIVALLTKMTGEIYACAGSVIAIGAGVFIWFAGPMVQYYLRQTLPIFPPPAATNQPFVAGLLVIGYGLLICFSILVLSYFFSEIVLLGAQIERNTHSILQVVNRHDTVNAATASGTTAKPAGQEAQRPPFQPVGATPVTSARCPRCGAAVKPFSRFCESCGATLD